MINNDFVRRKISLIQDDLSHLVDLSRYSLNEIVGDYIKMSALERILERIISRAIDINNHIIAELADMNTSPPRDYRETFIRMAELNVYPTEFANQISKSIGTRNVLIHEYDKVDAARIYDSVSDCLRDYLKYCEYVSGFISSIEKSI